MMGIETENHQLTITADAARWRDYVFDIARTPARAAVTGSDAMESLWRVHPRWRFLKELPPNATLLDIGAGSGGLAFWRSEPPERCDIRFYGVDLQIGAHAGLYQGWEVVNLDVAKPSFPGVKFSGFLASHLIEHLADPEALIAYMASVAQPGARVYLEWPSPKTALFPTRDELFAATGCNVSTLNFFDDKTHKAVLEPEYVVSLLVRHGFRIVNGGEINLGDIALEAMAHGRERGADMQTGLWYATGWATYLQAEMAAQYLPAIDGITAGVHRGRVVREGYQRGWGLQYGGLREKVLSDPLYLHAMEKARGQLGHFAEANCMNVFLLLKFFLPALPFGHIIEFGCFRGGSAMFMGAVCEELLPGRIIYTLDTFEGMPETDPRVDAHSKGDFANTSFAEVNAAIDRAGLKNVRPRKGLFEDTAAGVLREAGAVALAHIDCDIRSSCNYARRVIRPFMVRGGYIVFDDATVSSCLGATEAVEEMIHETGVFSEQIWPHFVFRHGLEAGAGAR
jgi:predicted O-methyltransferase YrrM/SAM-dependent methyltransferase